MLSILIDFERICSKYNLIYWLDFGTLLGSVRHQGFIPWDDDLDVSMPREDYEKFLVIAQKELNPQYFLQNKNTDKHIYIYYSKIRSNQSTFIEKHEVGKKIIYHQGIYIDIFPVNYIRKDLFTKSSYIFFKKCAKIFSNRYVSLNIPSKMFINILNFYHHRSHPIIVRGGEKMSNELHIINSDILPLSTKKFEGFNFKVPHNYENYLSALYGKNYMTLPPKKQRMVHSYSIYISNTHPQKEEIYVSKNT